MLNKIAKRIILLLCTITVVGVLSGCTETILSQNGPTAIFVAGKLDSDNTFSKSANWLENAFSKFENLCKTWSRREVTNACDSEISIKYS